MTAALLTGWALAASIVAVFLWLDRRQVAAQLRIANDRLYAAWREGAVIPDAPDAEPEEARLDPVTEAYNDLPVPLQQWVAQWEGVPEVRARWVRRAAVILRKNGQDVKKTLMELDTPVW